jgi:hypothetical protein
MPPDRQADDQQPRDQARDQTVRPAFPILLSLLPSFFRVRLPHVPVVSGPGRAEAVAGSAGTLFKAAHLLGGRLRNDSALGGDRHELERRPPAAGRGQWTMTRGSGVLALVEELKARRRRSGRVRVLPAATLIPPLRPRRAPIASRGPGIPMAEGLRSLHGNVSARMLADLGAGPTYLGHSERRSNHRRGARGRNEPGVGRHGGLVAIVCVGAGAVRTRWGERRRGSFG